MHSSRMHTVLLLTISQHALQGGVPAKGCTCPGWVYLPGGTCLGGVPAQGVYRPGGCTCPGGVPARGCTCPGLGVPSWGCTCTRELYLPRGYLPRRVYLPGGDLPSGVPAHVLPPPCEQVQKYNLAPNFFCGR